MIVDAHWDTALHLRNHQSLENVPAAHCDWQRLREFVDVAFTAVFVHPLEYRGEEQYQQFCDLAYRLAADIKAAPGIAQLLSAKQLAEKPADKLTLLGAEGGGFLGATHAVERLTEAYGHGLRHLGFTWNYSNALAGGCFEGGGISRLGKEIAKLCNEWGILLDGAHLSAESLNDLLSVSQAPIAVTHTACAALCPAWKVRNLLDWQLKAVAEAEGVVGICFVPDFLGGKPSLRRVAEHMAHAASVIGVEHVGLGSDLDGTELPPDVEGLQSLPKLREEMSAIGFDETEIERIMGGNFAHLLRRVLI